MIKTTKPEHSERQPGQALIEFALAAAILFLLLGAAVDAGLAYKSYQNLINATANASSFLAQYPYAYDSTTLSNTIPAANDKALDAFRYEQGTGTLKLGGTGDLNADGNPDNFSSGYSTAWNPWFQIDEATAAQVAANSANNFKTFTPTTECATRSRFDPTSTEDDKKPCYIVVRAQMIYKPFFLSPVFGSEMTIRAVSVKPIVGLPTSAESTP